MPRRRARALVPVPLLLASALLAFGAAGASAQPPTNPPDFAAKALNILPPGRTELCSDASTRPTRWRSTTA
jgi:hypothetical protein